MKNFILLLTLICSLPQLALSQGSCHFSAQVYSQDPCCIIISAGCQVDNAWTVVVDGATTYTVEFFVNGDLYWTNVVEVEGCDPDPGTCHFSAQVYSQDPCCIIINAGCENDNAWTVVVDGATTYDHTDYDPAIGGPQFLHCVDGNGTYTVEFFVNGDLWWTNVVEVEDCDPGTCHFSAQVYSQDPCCIIINAGCENDNAWTVVVDGATTYDYTDYDPNIGGPQFLHCVEENGTYVVEFFVNGDLYWTRIVEITDCENDPPIDCSRSDCTCDITITVENTGLAPFQGIAFGPFGQAPCGILTAEGTYTYTIDAVNGNGGPVNVGIFLTGNATNVEVKVTISGCGIDEVISISGNNPLYVFQVYEPCVDGDGDGDGGDDAGGGFGGGLPDSQGNQGQDIESYWTNWNATVTGTDGFVSSTAFPNPFVNSFELSYSTTSEGDFEFELYNTAGQLVKQVNGNAQKGNNNLSLDGLSKLPSGVYLYRLTVNDKVHSDRVFKQ